MSGSSLSPVYPIETLRDLVRETTDRFSDKVALATKYRGTYRSTSYRQLGERVEELAAGLALLGAEKGDRVAILGDNRTEWAVSYLSIVSAGLVAVPVDKDLKLKEIRHILDFSGTKIVLCGGRYLDLVQEMRPGLERLQKVVSFEEDAGSADLSFPDLLDRGLRASQEEGRDTPRNPVRPNDLAAILFTSGTMGRSKGVMLSHGNLASNILATSKFVSINNQDRVLSVLPLHHAYECTCGFLTALYQGASIYHAENLRRILDNMVEVRATVLLGVPLLFETMYRRIDRGIREKGIRKFYIARRVASISEHLGLNLRRRLFKQIHDRCGGGLRLLITGGAAINPEVPRRFRDVGIQCIQGYGMTEASPLISVNREDDYRDGSVGRPIPGVDVRIDDDEILASGPGIMLGYYENEEATRETIRDGWLHTGDLGYLDEDGFLVINGRRKSVIVTPNGKNIYPEEIEAALNEEPYVAEALVWGGPSLDPAEAEVQAILVPDRETFDLELGNSAYDNSQIREALEGVIKRVNRDLANYKRIRKFSVRDEEFEKTTTGKIKRYLYTARPERVALG